MFSRIVTLVYAPLALTVLAVATCTPRRSRLLLTATQPASQCNTGPVQCCNSVQSASSAPAATLLGLLSIFLSDLNVLVGITCSPISVLGVGGTGCNAQPVCCQNNSFNGVVAIGCVPVNINL
ncbi:hydrophobin [Moniliophthora roreri MCA 2997]|uniref:Hydrophobin n=2 Tax=Moniliophthora roreri TaxID=221103 RepID=V2X318_MONRO|nr:hydrophobin [Moniliophthora roreri MCA 2997]KAI3595868.1 hydrophobin [Moniliophthora roreri]